MRAMTVLEAQVAEDNWPVLERIYAEETKKLDAGIVRTFLLHGAMDRMRWRIA